MHRCIIGIGLAAIIAAPAATSAQSAFGVRAGLRSSELETSQDAGSIRSLVVGGYYGFGISSRLAIQFEAVYGARGAERLRVGTNALDPDAEPAMLDMSYVEVPVLLRTGYPGERFLPSFFFGPYAGFLLNCELEMADGESRSCDAGETAPRFAPRSTDFGLVLGGALDMALGESTVFVDARFTVGLLSIERGSDAFDARHSGLALSAGFAVPVGR